MTKKNYKSQFMLANFHTYLELTTKKSIASKSQAVTWISFSHYNVFQNNSIDSEGKKFSYISQFGAFCSIVTADLSRISPTQCACLPPLPHTFFFQNIGNYFFVNYIVLFSLQFCADDFVLRWELINGVRTAEFP